MTGHKQGPDPIPTEPKICEYCGESYNRKRFESKMEDIRQYKNRRYCSRTCADEAVKKRARDFYEAHKDEIRDKKKKTMKALRDKDPERYREISRKAKAKERESLFEMYGHICAVCGFSDKRALTLDHVQKNGNKERKEHGERGVYRKALSEYRPDLYRTLCMNCQFIERQK